MITNADDYFSKGCGRCARFAKPDCSTRKWESGLEHLRRVCRAAGLVETVKWGHPCYMHEERNIAIIGAFRGDFRLSFFNPALMQDPERVLEKNGPNTRHAGTLRFRENADVARMEPLIRSYLSEAISYARAGLKPPREESTLEWPDELLQAMEDDPELGEAFENLTPGRQKSYVINLNSAKASETRLRRIAKFRDRILSGKGATER